MGIRIDIKEKDLKILLALLQQFLPNTLVWAFGSRVKFTAKPTSDLDLVAFISEAQKMSFSLLKDALAESDLPFRVDLHDWNEIPENFKKNIEGSCIEIQDKNEIELPNNWKTYKVKELVELGVLERPMDGNHGEIHPKSSDFVSEGIPFIMATDIKNNKLDLINCSFIRKEQADKLRKGFSLTGDVLLTHKASIGRTAIVPKLESEYIMLTPQVTFYRILDTSKLNNEFLKHYFNSSTFQQIINSYANSGSTRAYIGITEQLNLPILLPPVENQLSIAQILTSLDDKIELNLQMNQTLEAMAQAIFKEWFVDFKFPGFDGELMNGLPKGWRIQKLGEICEVTDFVANGSFASLKENVTLYDEENYAIYVRTTDNNNQFNNSLKYTDKKSYNFLKKSKLLGAEIIISNVGDVGTVFKPPVWLNKPMTLGSNAIMILENELNNYLYFKLRSDEGQHSIQGLISGSAQPKFNKTAFRNMEILVPNLNVIMTFNEVYKVVYEKIVLNNAQIQTLTQTRDSLLPRLMSGKIEVKS